MTSTMPSTTTPSATTTGGRRLVFLSGLHRSGTTVMARVLARSPSISGLSDTGVAYDEGQFLQQVYPVDRHFGGEGRFGFAPAAHMTERAVRDADDEGRRLLSAWRPYWDLGRELLLEKTPSNLLKMRYLQALFPTACFVILVRQPVAVTLATRKWSQTSTFSLLSHWLRCHDLVVEDLPFLSRAIVVRYEAWVSRPEPTTTRITDFLGIAPIDTGALVDPGMNRPYFRSWSDHLGRGPAGSSLGAAVMRPGALRQRVERMLGRVTERLRLETVRRENEYACCVQWFEHDVKRYGYSLIDPELQPPPGHSLPHGQTVRDGIVSAPEPMV